MKAKGIAFAMFLSAWLLGIVLAQQMGYETNRTAWFVLIVSGALGAAYAVWRVAPRTGHRSSKLPVRLPLAGRLDLAA